MAQRTGPTASARRDADRQLVHGELEKRMHGFCAFVATSSMAVNDAAAAHADAYPAHSLFSEHGLVCPACWERQWPGAAMLIT